MGKERISPEDLEAMCHGCFWQNDNGHCKLINVTNEVQEEKLLDRTCEESMVLSLDKKMLPLVEISMVSVVRFKMAAGTWAMQVKP